VLWQAVVEIFAIAPFVLPSPTAVWRRFSNIASDPAQRAVSRCRTPCSAFALGIAVGVLLGIFHRLLPPGLIAASTRF